jgi:Ni,Fe-hydrogenase III small subunit
VPVDIWLPGAPPTPFCLIGALLAAVGKLAGGGRGAS